MVQAAIRLTNSGFKTDEVTLDQPRQPTTSFFFKKIKLDAG